MSNAVAHSKTSTSSPQSYINLLATSAGSEERINEISKHWKVSVLRGENKMTLAMSFAVGLTSTLTGETHYFWKGEFEDTSNTKNILRLLSNIGGKAINSYIRIIADCVVEALYTQRDAVIEVEDINRYVTEKPTGSVAAASTYYKKILKYYRDHPELFPTKSSDKYIDGYSSGAVLDDRSLSKDGHCPIAVKTGVLEKLFGIKASQNYSEVKDSLVRMGVMEGEYGTREEEVEKVVISDDGEQHITTRTKYKKNRYDERITLNNLGEYGNVYIFYIGGGD